MSSQSHPPTGVGEAPVLTIRAAAATDAQAVAELHTLSWQSAYRELLPDQYLDEIVPERHRRRWRSLLAGIAEPEEVPERPEGIVRLAERDGQLVAFISVWFNYKPGYDCYVENLHVRPGLRGGGIGEALLRHAATESLAAGHRSLALEVLEGNQSAIRFYERMGGDSRSWDQEEMGGVTVDYRLMAWDDMAVLAG